MGKIVGIISKVDPEESEGREMEKGRVLILNGDINRAPYIISLMIVGRNDSGRKQLVVLPTRRISAALEMSVRGRWFSLKFSGFSRPQQFKEKDLHLEFELKEKGTSSEYLIVFDHESSMALKSNGIGEAELDGKVCEIAFQY